MSIMNDILTKEEEVRQMKEKAHENGKKLVESKTLEAKQNAQLTKENTNLKVEEMTKRALEQVSLNELKIKDSLEVDLKNLEDLCQKHQDTAIQNIIRRVLNS